MKRQGFIVKVGSQFINWQGLLADEIKNSHLFIRPEDAATVSGIYEKDKPELVPHEREESEIVGSSVGTYFEYHAAIGH